MIKMINYSIINLYFCNVDISIVNKTIRITVVSSLCHKTTTNNNIYFRYRFVFVNSINAYSKRKFVLCVREFCLQLIEFTIQNLYLCIRNI